MSEKAQDAGSRLEFQHQNLWVGIFVLAALAIFAAVAVISVQERLFRREYLLITSFPRIEGLRPGAEVLLRGYPVGRVARIALATDPDIHFDVEFSVEESLRLPAGTRARLSTRGFGNKVLDLVTPGDPSDPEAAPAPPAGRPAVFLQPGAALPGAPGSDLDTLVSDALALTRRVSLTLQSVDALLNERVGPELQQSLASLTKEATTALSDLRATMSEARTVIRRADAVLQESGPKASRALDLAGSDLEAVGDLTSRLDQILEEFEKRVWPLADDLASALGKADAFLTRTEAIKEEDLREIMANLKSLTEKGNLLVEEMRRHPWRLLRRVPGEEKDVIEEMKALEGAGPQGTDKP